MSKSAITPVGKQVAMVHRRLVFQQFMLWLVFAWGAACLLAATWFLLEPSLLPEAPGWLRWALSVVFFLTCTAAAGMLGYRRSPSRVSAALAIDHAFGLRERVTTSVSLTAAEQNSPAGLALLADVNQRIETLDVRSRFPIRWTWPMAFGPLGALCLISVVIFYNPPSGKAGPLPAEELTETPANAAEIASKLDELKKRNPKEEHAQEKLKSEKLEQLFARLEELANKPFENKEQIRERVKEMTSLAEEMKRQEKAMADKQQAVQRQLQKMEPRGGGEQQAIKDLRKALDEGKVDKARETADRLAKKLQEGSLNEREKEELKRQLQDVKDSALREQLQKALNDPPGPARDLRNALAQGKLDKARQEAERLAQKLQAGQMSQAEKDALRRQIEEMRSAMDRLAQHKDEEDRLRQAGLDPETLQRELDRLKSENQNLSDLQQLAQQLARCDQAMKNGDMAAAAKCLSDAAGQLKGMGQSEEDLQELRAQLERLQDAEGACGRCMNEGLPSYRDLDQDTNNATPAAGRRPLGKEQGFKSFDTKPHGQFDPKGKKIFDGFAPGNNFREKTGPQLAGEIKQASQDAPDAIEQQRVPRAARELTKEYFERMRRQAEKYEATQKNP